MITLPSIAFGGFSGSAKGVTARQVGGRTILSVRSYPTGFVTVSQAVRRAALSKTSKAYKTLTAEQQRSWEILAEHVDGASVFGQKAKLSASNLFVKLNSNRAYTGESELLLKAPASLVDIPVVEYDDYCISEDSILFVGVPDPEGDLLLVAKMSDGQSAGVSNAWGKTVIISPDKVPDWGDIDLTEAFIAAMGYAPINGQRYFIEMYWIDPETGFTGIPVRISGICQPGSQTTGEVMGRRIAVHDSDLIRDEYDHLHNFSLEFAPGSTILTIEAEYDTGNYNVASAKGILPQAVADRFPNFRAYVCGRRGVEGKYWPSWYECNKWRWANNYEMNCSNRGGYWNRKGLIFGTSPTFTF